VLTSHTSYHTCPLIRDNNNAILLPTPIPESEVTSFGVAAPTTSTTVALALGDALTLAAADALHSEPGLGPREVFRRNHPGGAIGIANNLMLNKGGDDRIRALAVRWADIPIADTQRIGSTPTDMTPPSPVISESSSSSDGDIDVEWSCGSAGNPAAGKPNGSQMKVCFSSLTVLDCLRMAVKSPKGWLRTADGGLIPPTKLLGCKDLCANIKSPGCGLVVEPHELIQVPVEAAVGEVAIALYSRRSLGEVTDETAVVLVENGEGYGFVEVGEVIKQAGL
jgi:hypothetical protein